MNKNLIVRNSVLNILNVTINNISYSDLIEIIQTNIKLGKQISLASVNVNTINLANEKSRFKEYLDQIDIKHPDGTGVYLASKFLFGKNGVRSKITGSDFYIELKNHSLKNNWSFFLFGDKYETLAKISEVNPELNIKGMQDINIYSNERLIKEINTLTPDILLVGLGSPNQETWIIENKSLLNTKVIIAVGDGIKMFSNTKRRGPKIIQKVGLEWAVRLFFEPKRLWKRYLIGIPLFIFRIIKSKIVGIKINLQT